MSELIGAIFKNELSCDQQEFAIANAISTANSQINLENTFSSFTIGWTPQEIAILDQMQIDTKELENRRDADFSNLYASHTDSSNQELYKDVEPLTKLYQDAKAYIEFLSSKNKDISAPTAKLIEELVYGIAQGFDANTIFDINMHPRSRDEAWYGSHDTDLMGWHIDGEDTDGGGFLATIPDHRSIVLMLNGPATEFLSIPVEKKEEFLSLRNYRKTYIINTDSSERDGATIDEKINSFREMIRTHLYTAKLGEGVVFSYRDAPHRVPEAKNQTRLFFRIDPLIPSMMEKMLEWKKHQNY